MLTEDEGRYGVAAGAPTGVPSLITRSLHWMIALLVIFQGLLGIANFHIRWFESRLMTGIVVHQEVGLAILLLTVWMFIQRVLDGRGSGHGLSTVQARLAGIVHAALYLLILAESVLGIWIMGLTGKGLSFIFWHVNLPITPNPQLAFTGLMQLHAFVAGLLATLIVGHAVAALHHHFILDDDVLRRMLPWKPRASRSPLGASARARG